MGTIVENDHKAPFSIATAMRCSTTPFTRFLHFTHDPYLIMLIVNQEGIKYHFWVFGMTRPGIEPRSLGPLMNTLPIIAKVFSNLCRGVIMGAKKQRQIIQGNLRKEIVTTSGKIKYSFIAISPKSTLNRSGCTYLGPIYESKSTIKWLTMVQKV